MPWTELGPATCTRAAAYSCRVVLKSERQKRLQARPQGQDRVYHDWRVRILKRGDRSRNRWGAFAAPLDLEVIRATIGTVCAPAFEPHHQGLLRAARPTPDEFRAQMIGKAGQWKSPYFRWQFARASVGDARLQGKTRCRVDDTYMDAAARGREWAICHEIDARSVLGWAWKLRFSLPQFAAFRGDGKRLSDFAVGQTRWLFVERALVPPPEKLPGRYYRYRPEPRRPGIRTLSMEEEILRNADLKGSKARDKVGPPPRKIARVDKLDEPELARRGKNGDVAAREKMIVGHLWLVRRVAYKFRARAELEDMQQEAVKGLLKAWDAFDPERGHRFQTFAWRQVERAIQDYLDELRCLQRHQSTDALIASGNDGVLGVYAPQSFNPEPEHKLIRRAFEKT